MSDMMEVLILSKAFVADVLALIGGLLLCVSPCLGQTPAPSPAKLQPVGDDEIVRIDTNLISIPVRVMDRNGRNIAGLHKEDFRVFEDRVEQQIAHFAAVEKPFTVALLLDTSGSTRFRLKDLQDAAISFVDQLRPGDRVMIVSFNDKVEVLAEATGDRSVLSEAIRRAGGGQGTHLYDAIQFIHKGFKDISGRKAIVLFTDGIDNVSRHTTRSASLRDAEELAPVYAVQYDTFVEQTTVVGRIPGLGNPGLVSTWRTRVYPPGFGAKDYDQARNYLERLSRASGARYYHADSLTKIGESFARVAEELRWQYSLSYYPKDLNRDRRRHEIKVRVHGRNLVVRARTSYTR